MHEVVCEGERDRLPDHRVGSSDVMLRQAREGGHSPCGQTVLIKDLFMLSLLLPCSYASSYIRWCYHVPITRAPVPRLRQQQYKPAA